MANKQEATVAEQASIEELGRLGIFGALGEDALEYLRAQLTTLRPHVGEFVFREGETGRELFVVLEGEMEVIKRSHSGAETRVAMLGPGDWFGEMSILDVQKRSASVRPLAPSRLLRMSNVDLDALYRHDLKAYSIVVLNLARELSRRLRVADGLLADLVTSVVGNYLERRSPPAG